MIRQSIAALAGATLLAASGCGTGAKGNCPPVDICGGDPGSDTGWLVTSFCEADPVRPSQPYDVLDFTGSVGMPLAGTVAPPQPNPVVVQQTTSGDWCSALVLSQDQMGVFSVENAVLWHTAPEISVDQTKHSTIILGKDHSYLTKLQLDTTGYTHFAPRCLVANGAIMPQCSDLKASLDLFYKPVNTSLAPTFSNINCTGDPVNDGCDCTYTYNLVIDDSGTWDIDPNDSTILRQDSGTLTFNGATMNAAAPTTMLRSSFCARNGRLQLSGVNGGSLSNVQGLRTLGLQPM